MLLSTGEGEGQGEIPRWRTRVAQSGVGILVQMECGGGERKDSGVQGGPRITELLLYGTVPGRPQIEDVLTPPASSPDPEQDEDTQRSGLRGMRVRALPLSSDILSQVEQYGNSQSVPLSPGSEVPGSSTACFLPPLYPELASISTSARKRQRVANLFDDAAQRNRKARRKGGEGVSKAMAAIEGGHSQPQPGFSTAISRTRDESTATARTEVEDEQQYGRRSRGIGISRSPSISSIQDIGDGRPPSRRTALAEGKRSSLHQVTGIAPANNDSPLLDEEITIEQRNKDALSRIVMAGMRLYGLQQRKKPARSLAISEAPSQAAIPNTCPKPSSEDSEYKLIYHQTFKGAAFALRKHITTSLIKQLIMREVADKLLAIFCTDSLSEHTDVSNEGFGVDTKEDESPFAPASGHAKTILADGGYSTPRVRRRFRDGYATGDGVYQTASSPDVFHTPNGVAIGAD